MRQSSSLKVAAGLLVVLGVLELLDSVRILSYGSGGAPGLARSSAPFWAGVLFTVIGVAMLFGAYGTWKGQKWGKIVAIVTSAIEFFFSLGDVVNSTLLAAYFTAAIYTISTLACVAVIVLVLRRAPRPQPA